MGPARGSGWAAAAVGMRSAPPACLTNRDFLGAPSKQADPRRVLGDDCVEPLQAGGAQWETHRQCTWDAHKLVRRDPKVDKGIGVTMSQRRVGPWGGGCGGGGAAWGPWKQQVGTEVSS